MTIALARQLYHVGRSHAGAACLLYRAAVEHAAEDGAGDPLSVAFNGPNSLSITYLLGLGLELILKAAIVAWDDSADEKYLQKEVRHDLVKALDEAEKRGFGSEAPYLRPILETLRDPYAKHWLRYTHPEEFALPGDFDQVVATLEIVEAEMIAILCSPESGAG